MSELTINLEDVINAVRREERERAARIVEDWFVHTPYIVARLRLDDRKAAIARAIRGDDLPASFKGLSGNGSDC